MLGHPKHRATRWGAPRGGSSTVLIPVTLGLCLVHELGLRSSRCLPVILERWPGCLPVPQFPPGRLGPEATNSSLPEAAMPTHLLGRLQPTAAACKTPRGAWEGRKLPKQEKKKNTNKTSKHGSPSPEHVGQSSAPCRKAQSNLKFQESSDLATCTPRGPRHEPGRGLLPTLLLLPRAAGFCCWGRARSVVTSLWVQGPLSITGNELVRRGRRERETQKERKRLESSHFHFLLRDGPRPRAAGLGGEQSWLSTALSGLGSAASFSQRAHRSSPSL